MKFFKIQTGFGKTDYVQIDETEVAQAVRAQINGGVVITKNGTISGGMIKQILPDWNRVMGWKADNQLNGEDILEIGKKRHEEYQNFLLNAKLALEGKPPYVPSLVSNEVKKLAESKKI